tara:strand:- start:2565 stop:3461 length:897 start_codon:yes stop_codon:yes gene_type:complete
VRNRITALRRLEPVQVIRDLSELFKPTITGLSVLMAAMGVWLADVSLGFMTWAFVLVGVGMVVGSANTLNMYLERDIDKYMSRTRSRPLPSGRMHRNIALLFGLGQALVGLPVLYLSGGWLPMFLGAFGLVSYVMVYTPLKIHTPLALVIGSVPGAVPPLIGWAAATGEIGYPGLVLFGIVFFWQMPHFLAIAMYRKSDYSRAGIQVVPVVRGDRVAKIQTVAWATALIPVSLLLVPLGAAGGLYFVGTLGVSVWFTAHCIRGFRSVQRAAWGRRVLLASLVYLPAVSVVLVLDRLVG